MAPNSRHIQFRFDPEKFTSCVSYLASKGVPNLDKLKIAKLLYYSDKLHLQKYCRPITGDFYKHIDYGPIPQNSLDALDAVINETSSFEEDLRNKEIFERRMAVVDSTSHRYPIFQNKSEPYLDNLSQSEKEVLDLVITEHGNKTGGQLIDDVAKEPACTKTGRNSYIDYKLLLEDLDDETQREIIEVLEHDQELRDIFELSR